MLEALKAVRPLVLVLEDLHWSDHATPALVAYLAQQRLPQRSVASRWANASSRLYPSQDRP